MKLINEDNTNQITPRNRSLLQKTKFPQFVKNYSILR